MQTTIGLLLAISMAAQQPDRNNPAIALSGMVPAGRPAVAHAAAKVSLDVGEFCSVVIPGNAG